MDYIELKVFFTTKEIMNKFKGQCTEWENIFSSDIYDKGLISTIYKGLIQQQKNKQFNLKNGKGPE